MKRKMFVVLLVVVCLGVLVVEGISQPPSPQIERPEASSAAPVLSPTAPQPSPLALETKPNFSTVKPQKQEWTFEQLVEALKGVRARQKELKTQEENLLAKMEEKIVEKQKDLHKAVAALQQLRSDRGSLPPESHPNVWEKKTEHGIIKHSSTFEQLPARMPDKR
ncbi:MAG TPA: hypothetical protein VMF69_10755 [Gemmataceae bacterium]|nr:hypothetical protein [Gemmataceae bacterium]